MELLNTYPELSKYIESFSQNRRNEILSCLLRTDSEYTRLCDERANASMDLKESLIGSVSDKLFEKYSDALFAQEAYELDALSKQVVYDVLYILKDKLFT